MGTDADDLARVRDPAIELLLSHLTTLTDEWCSRERLAVFAGGFRLDAAEATMVGQERHRPGGQLAHRTPVLSHPDQVLKEENVKKSSSTEGQSASELIDKRIAELGDWRGETLSRMRKLIKEADPDVAEEWKWMGTPIWSHDGIICTGESYKSIVKLTFAKGASLKDPAKLFNSSLGGNVRRAIDIHEGEKVEAGAFKALIRAAVALNTSGGEARPRRAK
jgi:hypothetical protein